MKFSNIKNNKNNQFHQLNTQEIISSESELGILFPEDLKLFYEKIGYGFIGSNIGNINRIMDPQSVRDFRYKENDFEFYQDIDIYDEFTQDKLVFFEANESTLLSIGFLDYNMGKIYYYDKEIAHSLIDFLDKISVSEKYYFNMY
ncbi:SMI1/KNR4 family protein [Streptococcus pluranimalium]|uniref:SMI1/KNR4 family protein n=1 Tax=Streptococcus pluranimalium TaxID=82348 RepID=UPI0039FBAE97